MHAFGGGGGGLCVCVCVSEFRAIPRSALSIRAQQSAGHFPGFLAFPRIEVLLTENLFRTTTARHPEAGDQSEPSCVENT